MMATKGKNRCTGAMLCMSELAAPCMYADLLDKQPTCTDYLYKPLYYYYYLLLLFLFPASHETVMGLAVLVPQNLVRPCSASHDGPLIRGLGERSATSPCSRRLEKMQLAVTTYFHFLGFGVNPGPFNRPVSETDWDNLAPPKGWLCFTDAHLTKTY